MKINDIEFTLKDGRSAVIRSPREEDIPEMLEYLRVSAGETEFIMRYPEECGRYTYEGEKELFEQANASPYKAAMICRVEGRLAGNCEINFFPKIKKSHIATVGIALLSEYWNQGIGTRFFEEMIRIAEEKEGVLQIELEFIEGNDRARHLYEKMGFRTVAVHPDAIRLKDGKLLDEYLMIKKLDR